MKSLLFVALLLASCGVSKSSKNTDVASKEHQIYLVRHAEKADDGTKDPALTEIGSERAVRLANYLNDKGITSIYSTNYERTRSTVAPLAQELGLEIIIYDPRDVTFAQKIQKQMHNENILIVGHSNSTPTLTNAIIDEEKYIKLDETQYEELFIIRVQGKKISSEQLHKAY